MGVYLYAIRKLKRAQRITREDGAVLVVEHALAYVSKPYWDFGTPDRRTRLAMGRVTAAYGERFTGPVLFGDSVRQWDAASPLWWDTDKLPGAEWGVATDRVGDKHEARATKARLPTRVARPEGKHARMLETTVYALHGTGHVAARRNVFATQESAAAHVHLRGGPEEAKLSPLTSEAAIVAEFEAYVQVVQDWLYTVTPVCPALVLAHAPSTPTHEECMQAAGWL